MGNAQRKRSAEERIGAPVGEADLSLNKLRNDGVLVEVSVRGLSLCSRRTTNAERGITDNDVRRKRLTPGVTKTIPPEELASLEAIQAQIHSNLSESGYLGVGFNPARFITWGEWDNWHSRQLDYEARWTDTVERIIVRLPAFREECRDIYALIAVKTWAALWSNNAGEDSILVDGKRYRQTPEAYSAFESSVVEYGMSKIPSEQQVRSQLVVGWSPRIIMTSADYVAEIARYEQVQAEAMEGKAKQRQAQAEILAADRLARGEESEIRRIVAEKLRQQLSSMPDPREDMVLQLRQRMAGVAESTRQSIDSKGRLYRPTAEAMTGMVDKFHRMDVGDAELRDLIAELQNRLDNKQKGGKYDVDAIGETLRKIEALNAASVASRNRASNINARIGALEM